MVLIFWVIKREIYTNRHRSHRWQMNNYKFDNLSLLSGLSHQTWKKRSQSTECKKETLRSVLTSFGQKLIVKKISNSSNTNFNIFVKEFVKLKGDLHCLLRMSTNFHDFFVFCHLIDFFLQIPVLRLQKIKKLYSKYIHYTVIFWWSKYKVTNSRSK